MGDPIVSRAFAPAGSNFRARTQSLSTRSSFSPDVTQRLELSLLIETGLATNQYIPADEKMDWQNLSMAMDAEETTLTIGGHLAIADIDIAGTTGSRHFADILKMFSSDRRVQLLVFPSIDVIPLFQGYPQTSNLAWDDRDQRFTISCISEADELLAHDPKTQIIGQPMRMNPQTFWNMAAPDIRTVSALPLAYNPGGEANRSAEPVQVIVEGFVSRVYVHTHLDDPNAKVWNYADALRNLLYFFVVRHGLPLSVLAFFADTIFLQDLAPVPPTISGDPFFEKLSQPVESLALTNMSVKEGLIMLCDAAGVHFHWPIEESPSQPGVFHYRLRVIVPALSRADRPFRKLMIAPRKLDLPRSTPFSNLINLSPQTIFDRNRASFATSIERDSRAMTRSIFVGAAKRYEVTLLLRPGWRSHAQLDNLLNASTATRDAAKKFWRDEMDEANEFLPDGSPRSIYHGKHKDHKDVSDVGRVWVFPDTDRYVGFKRGGFNASYYTPILKTVSAFADADQGGGVFAATNWVIRPRPFGDTIGRRTLSTDRSPLVEFSFDEPHPFTFPLSGTWTRFEGQSDFDATRASLRIMEDNLFTSANLHQNPSDKNSTTMLEAYIDGLFSVRITCTIEGDERLRHDASAFLPNFQRARSQVIDVRDQFVFRSRRRQNSSFNGQQPDDARYEDRDDFATLTRFADEYMFQSSLETTSGPVTVPGLDDEWRLGDSFMGVFGLGIFFDALPVIVRKEFENNPDAGLRTTYHLSDLRQSPEESVNV